MKQDKSKVKFFILVILIITALIILSCLYSMKKYLNSCGYGISELPKAITVYLNIDPAQTIDEYNVTDKINDEEYTYYKFIGRHDMSDIVEMMEEHGYVFKDQMGTALFFDKKGSNNPDNVYSVSIDGTEDWCHWFRIYTIDEKIEDCLNN